MNFALWFLIGIVFVNVFSLSLFFALYKNIGHVIASQLRIIGPENRKLLERPSLSLLKFFYFTSVLTLMALPFLFRNFPL